MQITVKLFALMREKAGTDTIPLEVPAGVAVTQALATLVQSVSHAGTLYGDYTLVFTYGFRRFRNDLSRGR